MTNDTNERHTAPSENELALSLHALVRDMTYNRIQSRRESALGLLEAAIAAATGRSIHSTRTKRKTH